MEGAVEDYTEAVRLDPEFADAYASRVLAYTHLNKDAEAQLDLDRAVALGYDGSLLKRAIENLKKQR